MRDRKPTLREIELAQQYSRRFVIITPSGIESEPTDFEAVIRYLKFNLPCKGPIGVREV